MHPHVHSSIIYNSQDLEAAQVPPVDEWVKKLWSIYTVEYYISDSSLGDYNQLHALTDSSVMSCHI